MISSLATYAKANSFGFIRAQLLEIAKIKLPDLNAYDVEAAARIVEGTARNMGIVVEG